MSTAYRGNLTAAREAQRNTIAPPVLEVIAETGATYRQLDYWVRSGYLRPDPALPGSGRFRAWPDKEIVIAREMIRLTEAGLSVAKAAHVAREFANGETFVALAEGLTLEIDGDRER